MSRKGVVLVGHGGIPRDFPREKVTQLKALESRRKKTGGPPSQEEQDLETQIRSWPRTPLTDPYQAGLESLADSLRPLLGGSTLKLAYNEFCAPTLDEAVERCVEENMDEITVLPSMLTPGGIHSEIEIPETIDRLRKKHPSVKIRYIWPFNMDGVAHMLYDHIQTPENL